MVTGVYQSKKKNPHCLCHTVPKCTGCIFKVSFIFSASVLLFFLYGFETVHILWYF